MKRVPMFDYLDQYRELRADIREAIDRVLDSGQLILGPEVRRFESSFAEFLGGGHCVGVNSGTDALVVALRAVGAGPGDEIITVANTNVATVSAIRQTGARPVFCDIDRQTCLMALTLLPELITDKTRAIIPVHLYGNVVDVNRIKQIIADRDIRVIEDCAQAHGASHNGHPAGTMGDIGAFSFYPTKNLGAYGDAGLCFTTAGHLADRMRSIRFYGFEGRYHAEREGINSRLDELQAAVLSVKLPRLMEYVEKRRRLAERYNQRLDTAIRRIAPEKSVRHAFHLYVIDIPERDIVQEILKAQGISTAVHYPRPIHLMNGYKPLGYRQGDLPDTEAMAGRILSLPLYPELPESSVDFVCDTLNAIMKGRLRPC